MVRENIRVSGAGGQYAVSDEGTLLVIAGTRDDERQLTWVDRDGNEDDVGAAARGYAYPRISPDGGHLAVSVNDSAGNGIMIWDARREVLVPFADVEFPNLYPVWSPSGRHVAFAAGPTGDLYQKEIDSGAGHEMIDDGLDLRAPYFFSRSGEHLVFAEREPEGTVIRMIALGGNTPPVDLIRGGRNADLAPSGRHIVYQSAGESGTFEVYVRSFPDGNDLFVKISNNGGIQPVWSPDGRELFYIEPGPPPRLMTVGVSAGNDIAFSSAHPLLDWPYYQAELGRTYDVDRPGGGRFLVIKPRSAEGSRLAVEIVLDWDAAF
jgi:Tol biopolymer transport system component